MKVTITIEDKDNGVAVDCTFSEHVDDNTQSAAVSAAMSMLNNQFPNAKRCDDEH